MIDFEFEVLRSHRERPGQVAWTSKEGMAGILIHTFHGKGESSWKHGSRARAALHPTVVAETSS